MIAIQYINRLRYLDYLIQNKMTGTPKVLAEKLNLSERIIYEYIKVLKELGGEISYCKTQQSYCYTNNTKLFIGYNIVRQVNIVQYLDNVI